MLEWYNTPNPKILESTNTFLFENIKGIVKDINLSVRVLPLESEIQLYILIEMLSSSDEYIILNEQLAVLNRPESLGELVRCAKLHYNELNFGLLSQDFVDLDWSALHRRSSNQIDFELRCNDEYKVLHKEYIESMS